MSDKIPFFSEPDKMIVALELLHNAQLKCDSDPVLRGWTRFSKPGPSLHHLTHFDRPWPKQSAKPIPQALAEGSALKKGTAGLQNMAAVLTARSFWWSCCFDWGSLQPALFLRGPLFSFPSFFLLLVPLLFYCSCPSCPFLINECRPSRWTFAPGTCCFREP